MGNEEQWSMAEVLVGLNMLNHVDKTRGVPGDNYTTQLISLLLMAQGSNLNSLLFVNREYERPLHIMKESDQDADAMAEVVKAKIEGLPFQERTMIEVLVELSKVPS